MCQAIQYHWLGFMRARCQCGWRSRPTRKPARVMGDIDDHAAEEHNDEYYGESEVCYT